MNEREMLESAPQRARQYRSALVCVLLCSLLLVTACAPPTLSTATALPTATRAATATHTPPAGTATARPTSTPTPSPTPTALPTSTPAPSPTLIPSATPTLDCPVLPRGSFLAIWQDHPDLQAALGCPFDPHPRMVPAAWEVHTAYQPFERGEMIWSDHVAWYAQPVIYVLYPDGAYERFEDTFDPELDPVAGGQVPPDGLLEPAYGFGKVWRDRPALRERLGWATSPETPGAGYFQMFLGGNVIWIDQTGLTYVFLSLGSTVRAFDVPFSDPASR